MKDSRIDWIGKIPRNWEVLRLLCVGRPNCKAFTDGPFGSDMKNEEYVSEGIPIVQLGNIRPNYHDCSTLKFVTEEKSQQLSGHIAHSGDILVAKMMPSGKACVASDFYTKYVIASDVIRIIVSLTFNAKFITYALNAYCVEACNFLSKGATRSRVNTGDIKKLPFIAPSKEEQDVIVQYLDSKCSRIDAAIARQESIVEKLEKYRTSIISEAVTKGLVLDVKMKDSGIEGIGLIPAGWNMMPFGVLFTLRKGLNITKENLSDEGVEVISYGQVHSKVADGIHYAKIKKTFLPNTYLESNKDALLNKDDIVFADTSEDYEGIGNAQLIDSDEPVFAGYHSIIAHPKNLKETVSKYYAFLFRSVAWRCQFIKQINGVKVYSISQSMLKASMIIDLPFEEKKQIADYLDSRCSKIDTAITKVNSIIDKLRIYRQSVIYEAVTGKMEVK